MVDSVYKIFQAHEWVRFNSTGAFHGSVHDQRDGFIHLCAAHQLRATLAKHYKNMDKIVLAAFGTCDLHGLKWEFSRKAEKFPHVYGVLDIASVKNHVKLTASPIGEFILPEDILEPS